ncbi:ABC transporter substrate-binding protein [Algibacter marinivivus]|uniref:ABC transporter substrate-binding protein n=1 Tax=Algibacter marinivivus TaxID=2100723 RepID=A0A2U2X9X0_9FLAO|nr:ABC transporter substrate-binding protein [Algibacter marinivivus]PWH84572.1 ABC transporter substrate-binding protein [Algibacter marinivivus]
MFRRVIVVVIFLFPLFQFSQDFSALWEGHFSYNDIKDVSQGNNIFFAAADNAIFRLDTQTNEIQEINTVNGLSGESISTIYYSDEYQLLVVGYENGLIEVVFDNDDDILTVVDIIDKPTISPTDKKINHINPYQNLVYISTNYGISVYDLERLEFGDTYFIGNGGSQIPVTQTTIFEDHIYASCLSGNGIRKAPVSSPNLIDFQNWQLVNSSNWVSIEANEGNLYAINTNRRIYQVIGNAITELFAYSSIPLDFRVINSNLIVTTQDEIYIYDSGFNLITQIPVNSDFETQYTSATVDLEYVYIGTKDFGILKTPLNNPLVFEEIHPEGPLFNTPFSVEAEPNGVWVTFGGYDIFYVPDNNRKGFSHLNNESWINVKYVDAFEARDINGVAINPFDTNQVFISSFHNGLIEVVENVPTILYDQNNSGLESLVVPSNPNAISVRVVDPVFDSNGVLWTLTTLVSDALKSFNPATNQWRSFDFTDVIIDGFTGGNLGYADIVIGNDNTKWIASYKYGLIGFNENGNNPLIKSVSKDEENMPTELATALALDNRNQLWIGTFRGLRVLFNTSNFFTEENITVDEIIIEEDGIAKELLFEQYVTDIEVDGSNNKWIGTTDSGLFYLSSDGQNTIFHFTKDNSPLPSNSINDVSLDGANGIVYIATSRGLLSFNSGGSSTFDDLSSAYAYPNPVRPGFNLVDDKVKIKDISENVNIKITDIEGNLVAEAQSRINQRYQGYNLEIDGGTAYWNGKNLANNIVASGVYLIMLSDLDTFETKVLKLMVVR